MIPSLLESGSPSRDVWPMDPDLEEKQITVDVIVRALKPSSFADLLTHINADGMKGKRRLEILQDPLPVYLSHHVVFFSALDADACEDCKRVHEKRNSRTSSWPDLQHEQQQHTNSVELYLLFTVGFHI